jgi:predicted AAA+ superfamily ATPase
MDFPRLLSLELPAGQSAFLWGARKTGKSTLLRTAFPRSLTYDFLKTNLALSFGARPALLREQLLARSTAELREPIILDEVQKVHGRRGSPDETASC